MEIERKQRVTAEDRRLENTEARDRLQEPWEAVKSKGL